VAECDGLLNRWTEYSPSRGFESRPLRSEVTEDDSQRQEPTKAPEAPEVTSGGAGCSSAPFEGVSATEADTGTALTVTSTDKQDDKLSADDAGLASVIEAWPVLSDVVKAGVLAMVKAAAETGQARDGPKT
jgi:hypothetical protein